MASTITSVVDPDIAQDAVFLVTRRELTVLAVALAVVLIALLLLVHTGSSVVSTLLSSG